MTSQCWMDTDDIKIKLHCITKHVFVLSATYENDIRGIQGWIHIQENSDVQNNRNLQQ